MRGYQITVTPVSGAIAESKRLDGNVRLVT